MKKNVLLLDGFLFLWEEKKSGKIIDDNDYTYCPNKGFTKLVSRKLGHAMGHVTPSGAFQRLGYEVPIQTVAI